MYNVKLRMENIYIYIYMIDINTIKEFISKNYPNTRDFKEITLANTSSVQTFEFTRSNDIHCCFVVFPNSVHPKMKTLLKAYYWWYIKQWFNFTVKQKSSHSPRSFFITSDDFEHIPLLDVFCEYCLINARKINCDIMTNLIVQLDIIEDQEEVETFAKKFDSANTVGMASYYMAQFLNSNEDVFDLNKIFKNISDDNLFHFFEYVWKNCDPLMSFTGVSDSSGAYSILTDNNYYDANFQPLYDDNSI